jgi:hypothetical protein
MMNSLKNWYVYNQDAISWFIIGWMSLACLDALSEGRYMWALINAGLVWLNYSLSKVRL